jgi:hypothetical protein
MIQNFDSTVDIELMIDPVTMFSRRLTKPCIFIDTINCSIDITWHMEHTTPTGVVYFTTSHRQIADNKVIVNLATQERITEEQYQAIEDKPLCMGEYDYWHYANKNSPFPVMEQIELFGTVFAQRNGWLQNPQS